MARLTDPQRDMLQRLADGGVIRTVNGLRGGYITFWGDSKANARSDILWRLSSRGFVESFDDDGGRARSFRITPAGRSALRDSRAGKQEEGR